MLCRFLSRFLSPAIPKGIYSRLSASLVCIFYASSSLVSVWRVRPSSASSKFFSIATRWWLSLHCALSSTYNPWEFVRVCAGSGWMSSWFFTGGEQQADERWEKRRKYLQWVCDRPLVFTSIRLGMNWSYGDAKENIRVITNGFSLRRGTPGQLAAVRRW